MAEAVSLRPLLPEDLGAVVALSGAVGWPHRAEDLSLMLALGQGYAAQGAAGEVAGVGLWWPWGGQAATLGLVIVAPAAQGRGIGGRLMRALLDDTGARAVRLTATEAGRPLYERLGFRGLGGIEQRQGEYRNESAQDGQIRAAGPDDLETLVALDAEAFGAERRALIARLLAVGRAVLLDGDRAPRGFAIARRFGRGEVVGPIVAADEADAVRLFRAAARPGFVRVDCPSAALALAGALTTAGLPAVDAPVTMLSGRWPATRGRLRSFALASQALC